MSGLVFEVNNYRIGTVLTKLSTSEVFAKNGFIK